ncbi:MAG TPA: PRC-barrel domain-containing protein [Luteolibacter sp.]
MKIAQQSLIISLAALFVQTPAFAEPKAKPDPLVASSSATRGVGASWRASEIIGTQVKNASDETIGEVQDLVIDLVSGEVLAVVVASGGFLGMADTLSAVPVSAVRYDVSAKSFKTKLTKEQLAGAPSFKKTEWPDYGDETTRSKLRKYRDSLGGDHTAPDNTARNRKDDVNPMDQGNSASDLKITKNIRASIVNADLSFDAKNIKVITKDGHVTLKGVVKHHSEHEAILKLAKSHVDAAHITDELKMKSE